MAPVNFIGPLFVGSKSSYKSKIKGSYFEEIAIQYFLKRGFELKNPRIICNNIQIDAMFYKTDAGWIVLEVKSLPKKDFNRDQRVTKKQAYRILSFMELLMETTDQPVRAHLAIVSHDGDVELYEDFLCDLINI